MGRNIKLPNINFTHVGKTIGNASKSVGSFIGDHVLECITGVLVCVTADNIRVRISRKKSQKTFEKNTIKQQQVIRKHEAEINVLKNESEQAQEAMKKVDQLAQIVNNMTDGRLPNE